MYKLRFGAVLAAGALLLTFASTALAQTGHPVPISDTDVSTDCTGGPNGADITPGIGQVAWLFVHAAVDNQSGKLTADFTSAGTQGADSYIQGNVKYLIVTDGPDTITSFSDTIDGGQLVLSHVCYGPTPSESPSPSASESQPVQSESIPPSESPSASSSESASPSDGASPSESASASASESLPVSSPSGSVLAETGTPKITPPSTDAVGSSSGSAGSGLPLVLAAASILLLAVLVATPSRKRIRR